MVFSYSMRSVLITFRFGLALLLAILAEQFLSSVHRGIVIVTVTILLHTSISLNSQKKLRQFVIFVGALTLSHQVLALQVMPHWMLGFCILICIISLSLKRGIQNFPATYSSVSMLSLGIWMAVYTHTSAVEPILKDVLLSALIAWVLGMAIAPERADKEFQLALTYILQMQSRYLKAIKQVLLNQTDEDSKSLGVIEWLTLPKLFEIFPEWVFEPGIPLHLQQGQRAFLLTTETIQHVLCSLKANAEKIKSMDSVCHLHQPLQDALGQTDKYYEIVIQLLNQQKQAVELPEVGADIVALMGALKAEIGLPEELVQFSPEQLDVITFMYDIKDLQKHLINLLAAMRNETE
jgi:hypothetical protein